MPQDTRIALFLMGELVAALQANDPDTFKRWLYGGIQDLGEAAVTELLLDWIDPFITHAVTLQAGAKQQNECSRQAFHCGDCRQIHTLIPNP